MNTLTDMPNISTMIEKDLRAVGITTPEQLKQVGSRAAFKEIKRRVDPGACANKLYALEGAVQNIRWHHLAQETKAELKAFQKSL